MTAPRAGIIGQLLHQPGLWAILLSQVIAGSLVVVVISTTPLLGALLAPSKSLITLPSALFTISTGVFAVFIGRFLEKYSARRVLPAAVVAGMVGALGYIAASKLSVFAVLAASTLFLGMFNSSLMYYRFEAARCVQAEYQQSIHGLMVSCGALSAIIGGGLLFADDADAPSYIPTVYSLSILLLCVIGALLLVPRGAKAIDPRVGGQEALQASLQRPAAQESGRGSELSSHVGLAASAITAYMTLVMVAAPVAMFAEGMPSSHLGIVMQIHFLGMYLSPLIVGKVGGRGNLTSPLTTGLVLGVLALLGYWVPGTPGYALTLGLCGVAWGFVLVPCSAYVSGQKSKKLERQFSTGVAIGGAAGALLAGLLHSHIGWSGLCLAAGLCTSLVLWSVISIRRIQPA